LRLPIANSGDIWIFTYILKQAGKRENDPLPIAYGLPDELPVPGEHFGICNW